MLLKEKVVLIHEIKMKDREIEDLKRQVHYHVTDRDAIMRCAEGWHRLYNDLVLRSCQESQIFHDALNEAIESRKDKVMGFK